MAYKPRVKLPSVSHEGIGKKWRWCLMEVRGQLSDLGNFTQGKGGLVGTHWRGLVGPKTTVDNFKENIW